MESGWDVLIRLYGTAPINEKVSLVGSGKENNKRRWAGCNAIFWRCELNTGHKPLVFYLEIWYMEQKMKEEGKKGLWVYILMLGAKEEAGSQVFLA